MNKSEYLRLLKRLINDFSQDPNLELVIENLNYQFYSQSLYYFAKDILNFKDINLHTHGEMISVLESFSTRKLIVMPRGTLKSTVASVAYPMWLLLKNPNLRIMIDSETFTNSKAFLREIKNSYKSDGFLNTFGDWEGDIWNESEIILSKRIAKHKESSVWCSGVEKVQVGKHADVIICDDLSSNNNSLTKEGADKVYDHYRLNVSILEPNGIMVVVGTRYSEIDLIGRILKNEIGVKEGEDLHAKFATRHTTGLLKNS